MFESTQEAASYLSGLVDGEGSVRCDPGSGGCRITIWNTDLGIIQAAKESFEALGSKPTVRKRNPKKEAICSNPKDNYYVQVSSRKNIEPLLSVLRLRASEKAKTLNKIRKYYELSTRTPKHLLPFADLQKFLASHTQREAAKYFKVSQSTIERWNRYAKDSDPTEMGSLCAANAVETPT